MKPKFKVTGYQVVRSDNQRDNITLFNPVTVGDIEAYREKLEKAYNAKFINLNYTLNNVEE